MQTIGIGLQASMGAMLLACGAEGKRFVLPNARVMIHQPSSGTEGKITDQEIALKEGILLKKKLAEIFRGADGEEFEAGGTRYGPGQLVVGTGGAGIRDY